jgi:hypothetical protein
VAAAADAGSAVTITSSDYAKSDLTVAAYRGASASNPIAISAGRADNTSGALHMSPPLTAVSSTDWLMTYWADESSGTTSWTAPAGQTVRSTSFGTSSGHISALLTDSNGTVPAGATGAKTATANSISSRGVSFSVLIAPGP